LNKNRWNCTITA